MVEGQAGNYFGVVSTCLHLNPARAKVIRVGRERLPRYRWSSYPLKRFVGPLFANGLLNLRLSNLKCSQFLLKIRNLLFDLTQLRLGLGARQTA